jgi:hypothetical protein
VPTAENEQRTREIEAAIEAEIAEKKRVDVAFADVMFRVRRLRPRDGDFVAITHDVPNFNQANALANAIGQELQNRGKSNVIILVIGPGITVETFDEAGMAKAGWVRMSAELREAEAAFRDPNAMVDLTKFRKSLKVAEIASAGSDKVRVIRKNPAVTMTEADAP